MDNKILRYVFLPSVIPSKAEGKGDAEGRGGLCVKLLRKITHDWYKTFNHRSFAR